MQVIKMKWVLNYNKKYKFSYILSNILLIIFDTSSIICPILLGYIVDDGVKKGNKEIVLSISVFLVIFIIIRTLGSFFSIIKLSKVSLDITTNIKNDCYKKLNEMDNNFYKKYTPGELMTILTSDIATMRSVMINLIKKLVATILTFIISLIYCLNVNVVLTLIILFPAVFICIFSIDFVKKTKHLYKEAREQLSDLNNYIQDNIEGNKVVKAFSQEKEEIHNMEIKNSKLKDTIIDRNYKGIDYVNKVNILSRLMLIFCLFFGGLFLMKGYITIGQLVVFNSLLYALRSPFESLFDLLDQAQNFKVSKDKVQKLLMEESIIKHEGTIKPKTLLCDIEFKDVNITYNNKTILTNLNIKIKPNQTVAFIGPTGCGKSSIINLLLRFIDKSKGNILIDGIDIEKIDTKWLREKIGYVTQQPFLFSDTITNNIKYGNINLSDEDMLYVAKKAHLTYIDKLEEKYETIIGERGVGLSGGEKQRLSLARALAVKPELLILDDITSALDMETELLINESLKDINFPCTKIIIAQKIVSVKDADVIYVIDNNKIIEQGTHKELLKNKGYYYEIYKIQSNIDDKEGEYNARQQI